MKKAEIKALMACSAEKNEPIPLSENELNYITVGDFAFGARVSVKQTRSKLNQTDLEGFLVRGSTTPLKFEIRETYDRKYWSAPVGMRHYLDLVQRAIETRQRTHGDVILGGFDDNDSPCIQFNYSILLKEKSVTKSYKKAIEINKQMFEAAQNAKREVASLLSDYAEKLSGWGSLELHDLIDKVDQQVSTNLKGRVLEQLVVKLFSTIPGFKVTSRIRTKTEEIDIRISNDSPDRIWKNEAPWIIAECKNWSSKIGKDEFVLFQKKVLNRKHRCTCGFLISWNGFTNTITREILRESQNIALIILVSGKDLRDAVLAGEFGTVADKLHERAIFC